MSDQNKLENRSRSASIESHISDGKVSPHVKEEEEPKEDEDENSDYASAHEEENVLSKVEGGEEGEQEEEEQEQEQDGEEVEGLEGSKEETEGKTPGVDDDQDRRNPQYIPKRGVFYEHDDRIDSDEEEAEAAKKGGPPGRRVPKSEATSRWGHDKFAEMDQAPKTKDELVSVYGYDIRNEDTAPRARRRRKYGRGPNKYTRKWENEDAYVKSSGRGQSHKGSRGGSILIKKTGKRIMPDGDPNYSESKEIPPPVQKKEVLKSSKSSPKEQQSFKKDSNKVRPEHTGKTFNSQPNDPTPSRVEHLEKSLSRTHINNKQSLPPRRSHEKNNSTQLIPSHASVEILPTKPKRYSTQRQRNNNGPSSRKDETSSSDSTYYKRGNTFQTNSSDYPTTSVAYSNSTPFASTTAGGSVFNPSRSPQGGGPPPTAQTQTVPPPYMNPNGLVNYGPPPPVQYTVPVTVPVTVPLTMSLVPPQPENYSGVPLVPGPTTTNPPLLPPTAHHIGAPELMAAAALSGGVPAGNGAPPNTGYAEVRGGVTYFNPTAQAPIMMRPVSKRPKAAIPIIDPSNLSAEKTLTSCDTPEPSLESSDKNSVELMASTSNESPKLVT